MNMKVAFIESAAGVLLPEQLWVDARKLVLNTMKKAYSSQQKHEVVLKELQQRHRDTRSHLMNVAIAIAVMWAKAQAE